MGKFYKIPEKKKIILDTDDFHKEATDFQLEALYLEARLELEKRLKGEKNIENIKERFIKEIMERFKKKLEG